MSMKVRYLELLGTTMSLQELIPVLQIAVGPVILISGVGLLLLSMTNRFGRVIDRTRALTHERQTTLPGDKSRTELQLNILLRRAHILRAAIALSTVSMLVAALLIIVLFISAVLQLALAELITALFIVCMLCLIAGLLFFIADINVSLNALKIEVRGGQS